MYLALIVIQVSRYRCEVLRVFLVSSLLREHKMLYSSYLGRDRNQWVRRVQSKARITVVY